jgi:hypothetical protein
MTGEREDMISTIEMNADVMNVVPKHGKGDLIVVTLETKYDPEVLTALCDAMMQAEGPVEVKMAYNPTPLFDDEDEAFDELNFDGNETEEE